MGDSQQYLKVFGISKIILQTSDNVWQKFLKRSLWQTVEEFPRVRIWFRTLAEVILYTFVLTLETVLWSLRGYSEINPLEYSKCYLQKNLTFGH